MKSRPILPLIYAGQKASECTFVGHVRMARRKAWSTDSILRTCRRTGANGTALYATKELHAKWKPRWSSGVTCCVGVGGSWPPNKPRLSP